MKPGTPDQEKRLFPRKTVDLEALVFVEGAAGPVPGRCRDISIGGVYVVTQAKAAFGHKVELQVDIPGTRETVIIAALVRWGGPDGLGLQFGLLGAKETHAIAKLISMRNK